MRARKLTSRLSSLILVPLAVAAISLLFVSPALALSVTNVAVSKVGSDSAILVVKADVNADVTVEYGEPPLYGNTKVSLAHTRHEITLDGLSSGALVHYRVTVADAADPGTTVLIPDKSFHTARPVTDNFTFGVVGDNRPATDTAVQPAAFYGIVGQMQAEDLDLALNVGDIIYGTWSDSLAQNVAKYDGLFAATTSLTYSTPMYVAPGNHERLSYANSRAGYEQEFTFPVNNGAEAATYGEHYYSFNSGNTHFIALSTEIPGQEGMITGAQKNWLAADLAANTRQLIVAFMHRPLFSGAHAGDPWVNLGNTAGQQNKAEIHALFVQYGVDIVFEGHDHYYLRHVQDGIQYIITGGGGAPVGGTPALGPGDVFGYGGYEHVKVEEGDSSMRVTTINAVGGTVESFTIGTPSLTLSGGHAYWASYADYRNHELSLGLRLSNAGTGDAHNIVVDSLRASEGVQVLTAAPLSLGDLSAGHALTATVRFDVPDGVSLFLVTAQGSCVDDVGNSYLYPGSGLL